MHRADGIVSVHLSPSSKLKERTRHGRSDSVSSHQSLLFDIELDDEPHLGSHKRAALPQSFQSVLNNIQKDFQEVCDVARRAQAAALDLATGELDLMIFASFVAERVGHCVWLRSSFRRAQLSPCSPAVKRRYTFCVVELPDGQRLILDPHFREQFPLATGCENCKIILDLLPPVFVGTAAQLNAMVTLLCAEVELAFARIGLPCPPWRTKKAMLSCWLVTKADDKIVK